IVWHSRQAEINQRPAGKCSSPSLIACPLSAVTGSSCPIDHRSARCSKVLGGCLSIGSQTRPASHSSTNSPESLRGCTLPEFRLVTQTFHTRPFESPQQNP